MKRVALWRQAIEVNMAVDGVAGVLGLLMVHMVFAYGKILVRDGLLFLATFYKILGMGLG